jgi:hypothetical protein
MDLRRARMACMAASARPAPLLNRARVGALLAVLAVVAAGCEDGSRAETSRRDAAGSVRETAERTLAAGPTAIAIRVSSATASYSVRGAIDLGTETFRVRARVTSAPVTHVPKDLTVIGLAGETYQLVDRDLTFQDIGRAGCAFDPHAPVGSLGGAVSIQEALALVGIATRLLHEVPREVAELEHRGVRAGTYRVSVNPSAVTAPNLRRSDEWIVVNPARLARHLAPILVDIDRNGLIRRLSLTLRRFRPPSFGPGRSRAHRRERVAVSVRLGNSRRELAVERPDCLAME